MARSNNEMLEKIDVDDLKAFENLYFQFHPRLYAYSRKFIDDADSAKDLVQEVFTELWERRKQIEIKTSISGYLFRTVHNKCLNIINSQKVRERYSGSVSMKLKEAAVNFYNDESYNSIFYSEIEQIVKANVAGLPDACRRIFELSRFEGLGNQEIADKLQLSVRTVEVQIYKALKALKEALKEYVGFLLVFSSFLLK